ncbi:cupin domain-containing protein [Nocardioides rubriscoriae]|uniref:cupin domain-containing protein n=1 Tax=Nocardioides rubriscoriae TaxID=642762 RepID=UPI0011E062EE|nr:cupin domain-containing protein [Nocardioides rubriscoriae]
MRILELSAAPRRPVEAHGSLGVSIGAIGITAEAHLVTLALRPGGAVGRHPAAGRQLLVVLDGDAEVSGSNGDPVVIGPGQAAVWEPNELHQTRTTSGLLALVVEGDVDLGAPGHHVDPGDV